MSIRRATGSAKQRARGRSSSSGRPAGTRPAIRFSGARARARFPTPSWIFPRPPGGRSARSARAPGGSTSERVIETGSGRARSTSGRSSSSLPPDTSLEGGPSGLVATATASFTLSSAEDGATFECSLDGGKFKACESPVKVSGLGPGRHRFRARSQRGGAGRSDARPEGLDGRCRGPGGAGLRGRGADDRAPGDLPLRRG